MHGAPACSALCSYMQGVSENDGWHTAESASSAGLRRVALAREAVLHDPDVFDQEGVLDVTVEVEHRSALGTEATIVLGATKDEVHLELVSGDHEGDDAVLRWDEILDMVLRDA
jgi:hypothetical protein